MRRAIIGILFLITLSLIIEGVESKEWERKSFIRNYWTLLNKKKCEIKCRMHKQEAIVCGKNIRNCCYRGFCEQKRLFHVVTISEHCHKKFEIQGCTSIL